MSGETPMAACLARWHELIASRDPAALDALLAEDAVFHSPVVHTPQAGKALVHAYLATALEVLGNDSFRYLREVAGERQAVLEFETVIDGLTINGVDIIDCDDSGHIVAFKVMVRPLKAIELVHRLMGEALQRRAGG